MQQWILVFLERTSHRLLVAAMVLCLAVEPSLAQDCNLDQELRKWFGNGNAGAKVMPDGRGEGGAVVKVDLGFWGAGTTCKDLILQVVSLRINEVVLS